MRYCRGILIITSLSVVMVRVAGSTVRERLCRPQLIRDPSHFLWVSAIQLAIKSSAAEETEYITEDDTSLTPDIRDPQHRPAIGPGKLRKACLSIDATNDSMFLPPERRLLSPNFGYYVNCTAL